MYFLIDQTYSTQNNLVISKSNVFLVEFGHVSMQCVAHD